MRDLIMAALGAASALGFVVAAFVLIKRRENAERHREFTGGECGEFIVTMHKRDLSRDEYTAHDDEFNAEYLRRREREFD